MNSVSAVVCIVCSAVCMGDVSAQDSSRALVEHSAVSNLASENGNSEWKTKTATIANLEGSTSVDVRGSIEPEFFQGTWQWEAVITGKPVFNDDTVGHLVRRGVILGRASSDGDLVLNKGNALFACNTAQRVVLPLGVLNIDSGSIVYVRETANGCTVLLNFHDCHKKAVCIQVGDSCIPIPAGRQLILTKQLKASFDESNACYGIWYRTVTETHPTDDIKAFMTQFSALSSFRVLPAIRKMAAAGGPTGNRILKTAAAVYLVSHDPTSFRYRSQPAPVASGKL